MSHKTKRDIAFKTIKMKYFNLILCIALISCHRIDNKKSNFFKKIPTDITGYNGNAIVFYNEDICGNLLFIIPVSEMDSNLFKTQDVSNYLEKSLSIQVYFNHKIFISLIEDKNRKLLSPKACSMPYDSMYYSKVNLSYQNYAEVIRYEYDKNNKIVRASNRDSCNTRAIHETDSSIVRNFHLYN